MSSCSGDDTVARSTVTVDISGLERLENGAQYQAWISDGVDLTPLGRFTDVDFPKTFEALTGEVDNATQFFLSVEPGNDSSPAISESILLSGNFVGNAATVDVTQTFGSYTSASGQFVLQTPTDNVSTNENSGLYWYIPSTGQPGLKLPTLPSGWKYEGWVTVPGASGDVNLSTGRFTNVNNADESDPFSLNINPAPDFPGEDFINENVLSAYGVNTLPNLLNKQVFITIQPIFDNSSTGASIAPFVLRPLVGTVTQEAGSGITNTMQINTASFPVGRVTK
ncbi:anti-sigma factor [Leeuwenhoekiella blandensis]|uniref:anti-sigma factor n=1 Tax=Leeuwenhoekiella blandensis TaxID=360293 RepID=UPI0018A82F1A|nr:anti-sigma factor [Leeuwenhoekiella blandensis]